MTVRIREHDPERDLPRIAELMSLYESEPVTVEVLRDRERRVSPGDLRRRTVAEDRSGRIVACALAARRTTEPADEFRIRAIVDPASRRQGVGATIYQEALADARGRGAARLRSTVRDSDEASLAWARRRGFEIVNHQFESVLDLESFDSAQFAAGAEEAVAQAGIRFLSFADTDGSDAARRRLYDLNVRNSQDIPGTEWDVAERWPFERFQRDVFEAPWFLPDGQIIAAHGEEWIGLAAVGETRPNVLVNAHTGVLPEYRGRGIAMALKLRAIAFAKARGGRYIRTNNHSANGPMLAINRKLGYMPEPGWLELVCHLEPA